MEIRSSFLYSGLIAFCSFFLAPLSANATCVAVRIGSVSFTSRMHHAVVCNQEVFETRRILTSFLVPIPYGWVSTARNLLHRTMSEKGYAPATVMDEQTQTLRPIQFENGKLLVFEKENTPSFSYRLVYASHERETGIGENRKKRFAFVETFQDDALNTRTRFSEITREELFKFLVNLGFHLELDSERMIGNLNPGSSSLGTRIHSGATRFLLFRKKN